MTIISQNLHTITQKITNNAMSIVIEFIANTDYEIQIWIIKTCCKLYILKIKKAQNIESPKKIRKLKMLKPKKKTIC
jgi:hypothetical protein